MYVCKIRADLVGDRQADVNLRRLAEQAVGYTQPSLEQESKFTKDEREEETAKHFAAWKKIEDEDTLDMDFWHWNSFGHLNGWMKHLYYEKGGIDEYFNACAVRLNLEDLEKLKSDIQENRIKQLKYFFGLNDESFPQQVESTLKFIQKASELLNEVQLAANEVQLAAKDDTHALFYVSWW